MKYLHHYKFVCKNITKEVQTRDFKMAYISILTVLQLSHRTSTYIIILGMRGFSSSQDNCGVALKQSSNNLIIITIPSGSKSVSMY